MQGSHDYLGRVGAVNRALMTVDPAGVGEGNPTFGSEYDAEAREIARGTLDDVAGHRGDAS